MSPLNALEETVVHDVPWWKTSICGPQEIQRFLDAAAGEHISQGPVTAELEIRLAAALEVPYAVATTSGSVALLMALMALGIGRDDEVIVPNRTFIATAHAPWLLGAKVVLVDAQPESPNMDVAQLERLITPRTKAIMPVHLNGRAVDMEAVRALATAHRLLVIEDAAQALFSRNARGMLGTQSDAGCFSLGVTKLLSTGQGGFVVTRRQDVYERLRLIRNHGVDDVLTGSFQQGGFNFKFTDLLAAIGLVQLARGPERIAHARRMYARYAEALAELPFMRLIPVDVAGGEVPLWIEVLCPERATCVEFLAARGVRTRLFLPDLHRSPHLMNRGEFPHSTRFSQQGLCLPCGPALSLEQVERVIDVLQRYRDRS